MNVRPAKMLGLPTSKGPTSSPRSVRRYAPGVFLDITVMCRDAVSLVTVVWEPLPPEDKATPWPADHCN